MLTVYAVRAINEEKHRHVIGQSESIEHAKHLCNCAVLGNADYAYVKDSKGGTVGWAWNVMRQQVKTNSGSPEPSKPQSKEAQRE